MRVPLNITGGDFEHKSPKESNQVTRNFWPQLQNNPKAKSPYILQSFYGMKLWTSKTGSRCRGTTENQGVLYRVLDNTLYSVSATGVHTDLGTIPGSNRCLLYGVGSQIVVINGSGSAFTWDGSTLTQNTSSNLGNPKTASVINSQVLYDDGIGQGFVVSDVGLPNTINGLNNASAESLSDNLNIIYTFRDTVFLVGDKSIELWWNSGQGNPPFDKIQGAQILIGSDSTFSFAHDPDNMFFVGVDKQIHSLTGGASSVDTVVSNEAMAKQLRDYTTVSDAIGWTMQLEGRWFYVVTFVSQDVSWVIPKGGEPFQWGAGTSGRIKANSCVSVYGKQIVTEYDSGDLYYLDAETYTDAGETIIRTRQTAPIHGGLFKADGKEFEINDLEILLETGVGLLSGQGEDPLLSVATSRDGGVTFGTEQFLRVGRQGERVVVNTGPLGRFKECVLRIRVSDPVFWSIHSAAAEMEVCI